MPIIRILGVCAVLFASAAAAQTRVVSGTSGSLGGNSLAIQVALDHGFYKQAGVDAEIVEFKGGAPAVQAVVGGGIQHCICRPEHLIRMRNRGSDAVLAFALDTRHTDALVSRADSPVRTLTDLKGKRIGISSNGRLSENLVRPEAGRAGLTPETDFEIIGAGVGAAQQAAAPGILATTSSQARRCCRWIAA